MMTPEQLQTIRERNEQRKALKAAATKAPWLPRTSWDNPEEFTTPDGTFLGDSPEGTQSAWAVLGGDPDLLHHGYAVFHGEQASGETRPTDADLAFVAATRNDPVEDDVDSLLAEVSRLRNFILVAPP